MNKVILVGRLGQDPEMNYSSSGTAICKFSVATTKKIKGQEKTNWHNVVTFGKVAENCNSYLGKGRQVALEGEIDYQQYTAKDGTTKSKTEIIAPTVHFLGVKNEMTNRAPAKQPTPPQNNGGFVPDDIPF